MKQYFKIVIELLFTIIIFALLSGCDDANKTNEDALISSANDLDKNVTIVEFVQSDAIHTLHDLKGKKVGYLTGTMLHDLANEVVEGIDYLAFNDNILAVQALLLGKISGVLLDEPVGQIFAATHPELQITPPYVSDKYAIVLPKKSPLLADANRAITKMESSGAMADIKNKWISGDSSNRKVEDWAQDNPNFKTKGVLKVVAATGDPFCFYENGNPAGIEVDVMGYIAHELGMELKFDIANFDAMIPAIMSGKYDMAIGSISITEERLKVVDFSTPYYNGGMVALVRKPLKQGITTNSIEFHEQDESFWQGLKISFNRTFVIEDRYKLVWDGLKVTIIISIASAFLGTILGFLVCMMRRSKSYFISIPARIFIRLMQGMPMVVILMILYYIVFGSVDIDAVLVAILGFSLNFAAYSSEMMRAGVEAVDKGQLEAAQAMGFNKLQIFAKITFPQAARYTLPVFKGEFISMVKMTSIVGYIAIQDLTKMSDIIRSRTYEAFFPLIATALIYFALAYILTLTLSFIELKIDPKCRKRVIRKVAVK